jgi:hypothetical protein
MKSIGRRPCFNNFQTRVAWGEVPQQRRPLLVCGPWAPRKFDGKQFGRCKIAAGYLSCYGRIEIHAQVLRTWGNKCTSAQQQPGGVLQTPDPTASPALRLSIRSCTLPSLVIISAPPHSSSQVALVRPVGCHRFSGR